MLFFKTCKNNSTNYLVQVSTTGSNEHQFEEQLQSRYIAARNLLRRHTLAFTKWIVPIFVVLSSIMAGAGVWSVFVFVKLSSKLNSRSIVWITSIRSSSGTVSIIGVTKSTAKSYELRSELVELWTFCCCCKIRSSRICSSFSFLSLFSIVLLMSDSRIETLSRMSGSSSVVVTVVGGFVVVVVVGVVVQNDVVLMTSGSTFSGVVVVQNGVVVVVFLDIPSVLAAVEPAVLTLLRSICTCCRPFALSLSVSITWPRVCCCCSVSIGSPVGYKVIKMDKHGINNLSLFYYLLLQNPTLPLSRMITFWSASAAMRPTRRPGLSPPGSNFCFIDIDYDNIFLRVTFFTSADTGYEGRMCCC